MPPIPGSPWEQNLRTKESQKLKENYGKVVFFERAFAFFNRDEGCRCMCEVRQCIQKMYITTTVQIPKTNCNQKNGGAEVGRGAGSYFCPWLASEEGDGGNVCRAVRVDER